MDEYQLYPYLMEVEHQGMLATLAGEAINVGLFSSFDPPEKMARIFGSSQAILTAGAQVSKLMWADTSREWTPERRKFAVDRAAQLRQIIKPAAILQKRAVRNSVEHYDARLDDAILAKHDLLVDVSLASADSTRYPPGSVFLRIFDPATNEYVALEHSVNIDDLLCAVQDAGTMARRWLTWFHAKHKEPPTQPEG